MNEHVFVEAARTSSAGRIITRIRLSRRENVPTGASLLQVVLSRVRIYDGSTYGRKAAQSRKINMSNNKLFDEIRHQTRLALPTDDTYLYRLGAALYGFNSINSFMVEIITHIDSNQSQINLLDQESGKVLDAFRQTLKSIKTSNSFPSIHLKMKEVADMFQRLNTERSDFVHTYPITNEKNEQILHRRKDTKGKYFEVDNDFLDSFISRLHDVSSGLYQIRAIVKPNI